VTTEGDIRNFLSSRRARLSPERAGLPAYGRQRRVAGLRREEVALLAGISIDYYTRLERGNARGVSDEVLGSVAAALRLSPDERTHLENLVKAANAERVADGTPSVDSVSRSVRRIVDCMTDLPALVRNRRLEILYANPLGRAFYSEAYDSAGSVPSPLRYVFLDSRSHRFFVDWEGAADDMVGLLRAEAGRSPGDPRITDLVDELGGRSEAFAARWARHDVRFHRNGIGTYDHPQAGRLTLLYEDLDLPTEPDQTILVFVAEAGSASEHALQRLADEDRGGRRSAGA
jgi:transcriptional regulator with XRE-family HTH domain